jgi:hypothetical protein
MTKHMRECVAICAGVGLQVLDIRVRGKHLHIECGRGVTLTCGCTPSDWRWKRKFRAIARRLVRSPQQDNR